MQINGCAFSGHGRVCSVLQQRVLHILTQAHLHGFLAGRRGESVARRRRARYGVDSDGADSAGDPQESQRHPRLPNASQIARGAGPKAWRRSQREGFVVLHHRIVRYPHHRHHHRHRAAVVLQRAKAKSDAVRSVVKTLEVLTLDVLKILMVNNNNNKLQRFLSRNILWFN